MSKRKKKRGLSFGCLFWVLFFILIASIFLLNKETIAFVFEKTQAKSILLDAQPDEKESENNSQLSQIQIKKEPLPDKIPHGDGSSDDAVVEEDKTRQTNLHTEKTKQVPPVKKVPQEKTDRSQSKGVLVQSQKKAAVEKPVKGTEKKPVRENASHPKETSAAPRTTVVFFVSIDSDGKISRHAVKKTVPKSDSPMTDALNMLFQSPQMKERKEGMRSLIPVGTKLRSAWVKNGVAFINVSDEFQYNQYGIDGYLAQLAQVVFTATEFPTVQSVQILIEGQKKEYLGAEGVWIGTPLSRASF